MSGGTLLADSIAPGDGWCLARALHDGLRALRSIPLRRWLWATLLGLLALGAYLAGILPRVIAWHTPQLVTTAVHGLVGAYAILIAISVAEYQNPYDTVGKHRYWIAGACATIGMAVVETSVALLFPPAIGATSTPSIERLIGAALQSLMNWSLCGGLAIAVYMRLQAVRSTRAALQAAELARTEASREVLASRLAAMQAQVEPKLLLGTLRQIEALYDCDVDAGAKMLNALISYLRTALPKLRGERTTLGSEAQLARSYLGLVQLRMGSRLNFAVDAPSELAEFEMPPMVLLPLIESAVRDGLEPMPSGGRIAVSACAGSGRMRIAVADSGLTLRDGTTNASDLAELRARLHGLYGDAAQMTITAEAASGVTVTIDLPHETAGARR
jgi:hypothetical protein